MNETQQPETLHLADELDSVVPIDAEQEVSLEAASSTLRSQHAEIAALHLAAAAGKKLLKAHSDRIRELEAELKGAQADVAILQEQLDAIGAGGVGSVRITGVGVDAAGFSIPLVGAPSYDAYQKFYGGDFKLAWMAVWEALMEVDPLLMVADHGTGIECAVASIKRLAARGQALRKEA